MKRVYKTKGDDAKRDRITVPVTRRLLELLAARAGVLGKSKTEVARMLIEQGLRTEK